MPILSINTSDATRAITQRGINDTFCSYYEHRYQACPPPLSEAKEDFLSSPRLLRVSEVVYESLAAPLTPEELLTAIQGMACNMSPGIDGLPIEFYSTIATHVVPRLEKLCKASLEAGTLPPLLFPHN
ncbi:hypothetical protein NDU88_010531 [Pleurodeles waltl]|uniref:Uncharacterized protein n=1 Tax=Pleurodeles waltl TaxID=8319 RepID=A0AAV7S2X3_PLEWA|nr:hypothetical protein NDU88_010531 [Pleurodeles waltl]